MRNNLPTADLDERSLEEIAKKVHLQPEKLLMLAVLKNGIDCYKQRVMTSNVRLIRDEQWFFDRSEAWPFSFENICFCLQLDPGYIRQTLLHWKQIHCKSATPELRAS